ncbi:MAG: SLC13/DASS family transporter [Gammaproteobacteria bacterium]|nr:SLC13/DASS family transporter [Gammaproteobacteria bacterium]
MSERSRSILMVLGPVIALIVAFMSYQLGLERDAALTAGVTTLCLVWWISETIPIPVTSLAPLALFPMLGVLPMSEVSTAYGSPLVLLLLGGFILSTAVEKSGAHLRLAMNMVKLFGGGSSRSLVFGFMVATAVLSMWISNTATALMMLPVAIAVIQKSPDPDLPLPLLLAIAYGASIGGIGTPIGTPPNLEFIAVYEITFGETISFGEWMAWGLPVVIVFLPIAGLWLTRNLKYSGKVEIPDPGVWTTHERRVMIVFICTAIAWVTRTGPFGGWSGLFDLPYTNDAMVAFIAVIMMFLIPNGDKGRLLTWDTAIKIPWGMLLLFGAGISIAKAFTASGLSEVLGDSLTQVAAWPVLLMMAMICLGVTFLTEATSNTATTTLLMPILAAAAVGAAIDPLLLMVPAAMSASCAFMLPVATPPNVIVFSTNQVPLTRMIREGFFLNLMGVALISTICFFAVN